VKLTTEFGGKRYQISVENSVSGEPDRTVTVTLVNSSQIVKKKVDLLARWEERLVLSIGNTIYDLLVETSHETVRVDYLSTRSEFELSEGLQKKGSATAMDGSQILRAQMPGKVISILRNPGDRVETGEGILVIEAMKMQNEIRSQKSGILFRCPVVEGATVNAGDILFEIGDDNDSATMGPS
jgi:biotin carboxyl carrier protein